MLAYGFCVGNVDMVDFALSDHNAMLFPVPLISPDPKLQALIRSRTLNSRLIPRFCRDFTASFAGLEPREKPDLNVDDLVCPFNSSNILDSIAPVRFKRLKPSSLPWLNEDLRIEKGDSAERQEESGKKTDLVFL